MRHTLTVEVESKNNQLTSDTKSADLMALIHDQVQTTLEIWAKGIPWIISVEVDVGESRR